MNSKSDEEDLINSIAYENKKLCYIKGSNILKNTLMLNYLCGHSLVWINSNSKIYNNGLETYFFNRFMLSIYGHTD